MPAEQSYANHRRYYPLFHFVAVPILVLNVIAAVVYAFRHPGAAWNWWQIAVAVALGLLAWTVRVMVLTVQNRVVRLEERLRLDRVLPDDLRARAGELRTSDLIALRFCSDEELPAMCRAVLNGELKGPEDIKRSVKQWRPDWLRA